MASKTCKEEQLQGNKRPVSWDDCPNEILLIILDMLPLPAIAICMFVNRKWNSVCQRILDIYNLWPELVDIHIPHKGEPMQLKSKLGWNQIYRNGLLWNNLERASFHLSSDTIESDNVKKLNIYRDNLIVVNSTAVKYFGIPDLNVRREFEATCVDFVENDYMIAHVSTSWNDCRRMRLYGKSKPEDFSNPGDVKSDFKTDKIFDNVVFYRIIHNVCYVMSNQGMLWTLEFNHPKWTTTFVARYYGSPQIMCGFNVYDGSVYLWESTGYVMSAQLSTNSFKKVMQIKMPFRHMEFFRRDYMFHMFGFVLKVREDRSLAFNRYALNQFAVFSFECPNLSCMLEHGDMVLLANSDGTINIYRPRDLRLKTAVHTISLKSYVQGIENPSITSMEVFEDVDTHHLFVSTTSHVYHFKIVHSEADKYMWTEFPMTAQMMLDYHTQGKMHPF